MKSLNNIGITIPGGYRWFCSETKTWVPAVGSMPNYTDFIYSCKLHCQANNLPIGSQWEQGIQDQLCTTLDGDWCQEGGIPLPTHRSGWGGFDFMAVVQGTITLAHWLLKAGGKLVEPVESERRALICATCPMNQEPVGCSTCSMDVLRQAAISVVGGAATAYDSQLRSCKVCGCALKAKVHLPLNILQDNLRESQMNALPNHCWLKA